MSLDFESNAPPIQSVDELIAWFRVGEKPKHEHGVGIEHEKLVYRHSDGAAVSYDGGVAALLRGFIRLGWEPLGDGPVVALKRAGVAITLEPGGQIELAGAVHRSLIEVKRELDEHVAESQELGDELGIGLAWYGMRPMERASEVAIMPKERYRRMSAYLPRKGRRALDMMFLTATVQANFDYVDEADMVAKMRLATAASPMVAAIFAHSPYRHGSWDGYRTSRYAAWREVDPDRCGILDFVFDEDFGYRRYLDYALDIPMLFFRRDGRFVDLGALPFRRFLEEGHGGHRPNLSDFETHLSLMFPEVRLKRFIEVRSVDCVPPAYALASVALWKGLLYDDDSRSKALELLRDLRGARLAEVALRVAQDGLAARTGRFDVLEIARELAKIAACGLNRIDPDASKACMLDPVHELLDRGATLADDLVERFGRELNSVTALELLRSKTP